MLIEAPCRHVHKSVTLGKFAPGKDEIYPHLCVVSSNTINFQDITLENDFALKSKSFQWNGFKMYTSSHIIHPPGIGYLNSPMCKCVYVQRIELNFSFFFFKLLCINLKAFRVQDNWNLYQRRQQRCGIIQRIFFFFFFSIEIHTFFSYLYKAYTIYIIHMYKMCGGKGKLLR